MTTSVEYIISYGSLLSEFSRKQHSKLHDSVVPVTLTGWRRSWCTRYLDEGTTYAGAFREANATISGVLVPTKITDALRLRERYYDFVRVSSDIVRIHKTDSGLVLSEKTLWVCETRAIEYPASGYPLPAKLRGYMHRRVH